MPSTTGRLVGTRDRILGALARIADAYSNKPASPQILTPFCVDGRKLLAIRTGSFIDGRLTVVRNVVLNGVLLRHADRLLARDARGNLAVAHRSTTRGVTHVHAADAERPLVVRVFAHYAGSRDPLDEYERVGTFDGKWSSLSSDEYADAVAALVEDET